MKLVFLHSGEKVKVDKDKNIYVDGSYPKEMIEFYKSLCDDLTFIFRKDSKCYDKKELEKKYLMLDTENIKYKECFDFNKSVKTYFSISKRIKNRKIIKNAVLNSDVIIARVPSLAGYLGIKYSKMYNKKCIVEVVGCSFDTLINLDLRGKILAIPSFLKQRLYIKKAENVVYVSNEFLQKRYPNRKNTLACSDVVIENVDDKVLEKRIKEITNNDSKIDISLCTVGAIDVSYKGQEYVIKAISGLKNRGYNIKYYVIGGGDTNYLQNIAKEENVLENIIFTGSIPHEEVFKYLDKIDIYIQPSNVEGLCRSIIEAMSRACPIIVSNVGGNIELIKNETFIFKKRNIKKLINCIEKMSKEKQIIEAKNNFNNSKKFEKNYLKEKRIKFYKRIINS